MSKIPKLLIVSGVAIAIIAGIIWVYKNKQQSSLTENFAFRQDTHQAGFGVDAARIDSQITLKIPEGKAQEIYQYVRDTYSGQQQILNEKFPLLKLTGEPQIDISEFTDKYFDTSNLNLHKQQNSVRYRKRVNTTNPEDQKSGRELIQVKATPPGQFDMRAEIKFSVENNASINNRTPIIQLVEKKQQDDFVKALTGAGIDPTQLRHTLTIAQTRSRVYLDSNGQNILSFSVDQGSGQLLWATGTFSSMDVGLTEIAYTEADEKKRELFKQLRAVVIEDLRQHFPELTVETDDKYNLVLNQLKTKIPGLEMLIKLHIV